MSFIDERFLEHRRRSTSYAGMAGAVAVYGFWAYRYFGQHVFSWDLFAILAIMALTKIGLMVWYRVTD